MWTGLHLVEVNVEPTESSRFADYSICGKAREILPKILEEIIKVSVFL